jgi:HEAT repeat protein
VQVFALRTLGRGSAAASEAIPRMIELLGDRDERVCVAAAEALGSLGPLAKDAIPALKKLASSRISTRSGVAADALKKIETPR